MRQVRGTSEKRISRSGFAFCYTAAVADSDGDTLLVFGRTLAILHAAMSW